MTSVLLTGASGQIGSFLRNSLSDLGYRLRCMVLEPDAAARPGEQVVAADLRDAGAVREAVNGVDAVIHLAGIATEAPFADVLSVNVTGTQHLLQAAAEAGVRRVLVASSNHAVGFTPRMPLAPVEVPLRPDTFYGWSKAAVESLCRLYVDRHQLQIACLRIGSCYPRPSTVRQLSTWLSPADCTLMMDACLRTDRLGFAAIYGVSANTRGWWDLAPGRDLGFDPRDDAERYAAELIAEQGELDPDAAWLGGEFTRRPG